MLFLGHICQPLRQMAYQELERNRFSPSSFKRIDG